MDINVYYSHIVIPETAGVKDIIKEVSKVEYSKYIKYERDEDTDKWKRLKKSKKVDKVDYYYRYDELNARFIIPRGWLNLLETLLIVKGINYKLNYKFPDANYYKQESYPIIPQELFSSKYQFQMDAVLEAKKSINGIIKHPTGAGKTITMLKLISWFGVKSLIIVPNLTLFNQTVGVFKKYFGENLVGELGEGKWNPKAVTVATVQTLWSVRNEEKWKQYKQTVHLLCLDEAHHVSLGSKVKNKRSANSWFWIAYSIPATYRFGFTATPGNGTQLKLLTGVTGNIIHSVTTKYLVDIGVLVGADIKIYPVDVYNNSYDWKVAFDNLISCEERNNKIVEIAKECQSQGKRVLIITNRIKKQGKILHDLIKNSKFLTGQSSSKKRTEVISGVKDNDYVLIGTIFGEGTDIPAIDVLIIANGGVGEKSVLQRLGRGLRTFSGKDRVTVIDFYDQDDALLKIHSDKRMMIYRSEEAFNVEVMK